MGLYTGLIRLHVLHHAAKEPVYGLEVPRQTEAASCGHDFVPSSIEAGGRAEFIRTIEPGSTASNTEAVLGFP